MFPPRNSFPPAPASISLTKPCKPRTAGISRRPKSTATPSPPTGWFASSSRLPLPKPTPPSPPRSPPASAKSRRWQSARVQSLQGRLRLVEMTGVLQQPDSTRRGGKKREPLVVVIQDNVVIGADELVLGWIQRHNFDLWIVRFQPSDHFFSGLFRRRMANDKQLDIMIRA